MQQTYGRPETASPASPSLDAIARFWPLSCVGTEDVETQLQVLLDLQLMTPAPDHREVPAK